MKKLFIVLILSPLFSNAQNIFRAVIKDSATNKNLVSVSASIDQLNVGSASDTSGMVILRTIPNGNYKINFSAIGYESREMEFSFPLTQQQPVEIFLKSTSEQLNEVIVTSTRTNSRIENIPIRVEVIGHDEVNEESNIKPANISKLLTESSSVQTQQTSAINGNVSIRLQGLDGKYTQILKDGFPLYGGFAQGLSIVQIPPLDLKQVEIIKGSSSSLYGSDAIGGIINLISKQPQQKRELTFLMNQTSLNGRDADAYFSQRWKKFGFSFLTANNFQKATDVNKDGFSDLPKIRTFNIAPTFYYYINPTATLSFGLNGSFDKRKGGDMLVLKNQPDSLHKYFEENTSNRVSSQLEFDKHFKKERSLTIKNSVSYFNRSIYQPLSAFKGKQVSSYTEAAYVFKAGKHQFVTGANVITEKFLEDSTKSHLQRNYNHNTAGIFLQDDWRPAPKFSLQAGLRTDYQNLYGVFVLPRLAAMYKFTRQFYIRAGGGYGYKIPGIFSTASEQAGINNIQPLSAAVEAERSVGGNLDFNYKKQMENESSVSINQSFFVTQINNPLVLNGYNFINESSPVVTKGFETNLRLQLDQLQFFVGYTFADARREYDAAQSFVPLTPKHKLNIDIIYEKEDNFSVAAEGYYLSSMYRDFDTKTKPFFTTGLIVQKHFKHFDLIANGENLFDVRQTRFENIVLPPTAYPTFRQIYAPLEGRVFNVALRIKL